MLSPSLIVLTLAMGFATTPVLLRVIDGDTVVLQLTDKKEKIRLFGIDCPERKQTFGDSATLVLQALLEGKSIRLEKHGRDRYGRIIGEIFVDDSLSTSAELVRLGACWWYKRYAKKRRDLDSLQTLAKAKGRGLWAKPNPVAPWKWRRLKI